jgi:hypothetical protein
MGLNRRAGMYSLFDKRKRIEGNGHKRFLIFRGFPGEGADDGRR